MTSIDVQTILMDGIDMTVIDTYCPEILRTNASGITPKVTKMLKSRLIQIGVTDVHTPYVKLKPKERRLGRNDSHWERNVYNVRYRLGKMRSKCSFNLVLVYSKFQHLLDAKRRSRRTCHAEILIMGG